jgi:hypothetical protein
MSLLYSIYNSDEESRNIFCDDILSDGNTLIINDKLQCLYLDIILRSVGYYTILECDISNLNNYIIKVGNKKLDDPTVLSINQIKFNNDNYIENNDNNYIENNNNNYIENNNNNAPAESEEEVVGGFLGLPTEVGTAGKSLDEPTYVYDIETTSGRFHCGPGFGIYHNTDSFFFILDKDKLRKLKAIDEKKMLQYTFDTAKIIGADITNRIGKFPHELEYEKTFYRFLLMGKKLYAGYLYVDDVNDKKLKTMGDVIVKRNFAIIVKGIYTKLIMTLLDEGNKKKAILDLRNDIQNMFDGNYKIDDFVITKTVKSKKSYSDHTRIAHRVLATRIEEREPGNVIQSNQRLEYIFIDYLRGIKHNKLIGEDIETPTYIKENDIMIDYIYYFEKQILNPITKVLDLLVENSQDIFTDILEKQFEIRNRLRSKYDNKIRKQLEITNFFNIKTIRKKNKKKKVIKYK